MPCLEAYRQRPLETRMFAGNPVLDAGYAAENSPPVTNSFDSRMNLADSTRSSAVTFVADPAPSRRQSGEKSSRGVEFPRRDTHAEFGGGAKRPVLARGCPEHLSREPGMWPALW